MALLQLQHQKRKIGFKSVQLFKDQTLGIGSYGAVCKAKCDDLLCAAKILHPTLFDPTAQLQVSRKQEHRLPIKRFEQECEFLSIIRHPNIVQYLCMHQDPDTGLPVLLMELMDKSLTHFLENSPQPIAYHIQVNVCHDITLALSFLHSNGIIHRDLSSNNVLLRGNVLAKVTDFGMAKLGDLNPQATRYTFTMCPGTDVYMPPEAVQDEPVYTEKIDCFSFGVIIIQSLTRQFPKPGNRWQKVKISHPGLPRGTVAVRLAEADRRQNHISQVDPNHPLLPIALNCLKDEDVDRPSAQQLCERIASLKERAEYSDSVAGARQQVKLQQRGSEINESQLEQLRGQLQQLQQSLVREKEEKQRQLGLMQQQLLQLQQKLSMEVKENDRHLQIQQLKTDVHERAELEGQFHELEGELPVCMRDQATELQYLEATNNVADIKLTWRDGDKAPFTYRRKRDAITDGCIAYFLDGSCHLWTYDISNECWSQLSEAPYVSSSLAVLDGMPTTIGGDLTDKLMSYTEEGEWMEKFPPMQAKRKYVTAVCTGAFLILAGGVGDRHNTLTMVEVLNIENHQWSTAVDLPKSLYSCSATVYGDWLYMLGGRSGPSSTNKSVYMCSVKALLQTCTQVSPTQTSLLGTLKRALSLSNSSSDDTGIWGKLPADLPVAYSTCVTFCGQLLAIGGGDSDWKPTTAVYMYNRATTSWDVISHMTIGRISPYAAVLPDNQLMVVGGEIKIDKKWIDSDSVEFGSLC